MAPLHLAFTWGIYTLRCMVRDAAGVLPSVQRPTPRSSIWPQTRNASILPAVAWQRRTAITAAPSAPPWPPRPTSIAPASMRHAPARPAPPHVSALNSRLRGCSCALGAHPVPFQLGPRAPLATFPRLEQRKRLLPLPDFLTMCRPRALVRGTVRSAKRDGDPNLYAVRRHQRGCR
jgi:hypothetical protein